MRSGAPWSVDVETIDRARILRGWTRRDLGHRARVDEGTLCDLFARRRTPTFGTLRALCRALDMPLEIAISFRDQNQDVAIHNPDGAQRGNAMGAGSV
jgi:transcriptional regulator with XRE-family HTH domain